MARSGYGGSTQVSGPAPITGVGFIQNPLSTLLTMNKLHLKPGVALAVALVLAPGVAGVAAGQTSGSESGLVMAQGLAGAGGDSVSVANNKAYASLGQPLTGVPSESANFKMHSSVSFVVPEVITTGPILAGVRPGAGGFQGGQIADVFGFNFTEPAAGPLDVAFDGVLGGSTVVVTNLQASTVTPLGVGPLGNPKAAVTVDLANLLGTHSDDTGYAYVPALVEESLAVVGGTIQLQLLTFPGDSYFLVHGKSVPGVGIPLAPYDGALEVLLNVQVLASFAPTAGGTSLFQINIPNDPVLAGGILEFQALSVTDFLSGNAGFSNRREVHLHP